MNGKARSVGWCPTKRIEPRLMGGLDAEWRMSRTDVLLLEFTSQMALEEGGKPDQ